MRDPAEYNLTKEEGRAIRRGRDYVLRIQVTDLDENPVNLTGYSLYSQIRTEASMGADLVAEFAAAITDAATGWIELRLTELETEAITHDKGRWDLLLISNGGLDYTYLEGAVQIIGSVSRKPV